MNFKALLKRLVLATIVVGFFSLGGFVYLLESTDYLKNNHDKIDVTANQPHFSAQASDLALKLSLTLKEKQDLERKIFALERQLAQYKDIHSDAVQTVEDIDDGLVSDAVSQEFGENSQDGFSIVPDDQVDDEFEALKQQVFSESIDGDWSNKMQASIGKIEEKLQANSSETGFVQIASKECRSTSCLVEYIHKDDIDMVDFVKTISLDEFPNIDVSQTSEGEIVKIVAIYTK